MQWRVWVLFKKNKKKTQQKNNTSISVIKVLVVSRLSSSEHKARPLLLSSWVFTAGSAPHVTSDVSSRVVLKEKCEGMILCSPKWSTVASWRPLQGSPKKLACCLPTDFFLFFFVCVCVKTWNVMSDGQEVNFYPPLCVACVVNFFYAVLLLLVVQVYVFFWLAAAALSARSSALYFCSESLPANFSCCECWGSLLRCSRAPLITGCRLLSLHTFMSIKSKAT